jgi:2-polyprenyl-6-methoxyphenol hydroxylase-like FAD-dependent oxidoreductase
MSDSGTSVLIVGGGPVGLALACELGLRNVDCMLVEKRDGSVTVPKQSMVSSRNMEFCRRWGISQAVRTAVWPESYPRDFVYLATLRGQEFLRIRMPSFAQRDPRDYTPEAPCPCPQIYFDPILLARMKTFASITPRYNTSLESFTQDEAGVTATLTDHATGKQRSVRAHYLVGCDGASSRVRDLAGIPFPGHTYPEVQRLGSVTVPDSVTLLDNGDIEVAGYGTIPFGFTPTERGVFAVGSTTPGVLGLYTSEEESTEYDDDVPMTLTELQDSVRRVLGVDLPFREATRLTRFTFHARQVERYRDGRILMAGDAAHLFPAPGVALGAGMLDSVNLGWKLAAAVQGWAPAGLLDTYHDERHLAADRTMLHAQAQVALRRGHDAAADALRDLFLELFADEQPLRRIGALMAGADILYPLPGHDEHPLIGTFAPDLALHTDRGPTSVAELMHPARPILLDLADRPDLRETARDWQHRIDIHTAETDHRPARRPLDPPGRLHRLGRNHR